MRRRRRPPARRSSSPRSCSSCPPKLYERSCFLYSIRMPPATVTRGAATRAAILDRGVDLASAEGLEALTIGRLAGDLGMSKSGLFAPFGSKQDLQLAIVETAARHFQKAVIDPVRGAPDGGPRLRAMTSAY